MSDQIAHVATSQVQRLLEDAARFAASGNLTCARSAYAEAVLQDLSGCALNAFGCFLWESGCNDEALRCFCQLLQNPRTNDNLRSIAWNNRACVHRTRGETALAAAAQQQSLAAGFSGDLTEATPPDFGCDLSNRANDALLAGELGLAERFLQRALAWDVAQERLSDQACDWGSLGLVAALGGDLSAALNRFSRALRMHQALGDERSTGCDLLHLGEICEVLGRRRAAIRLIERAALLFLRSGAAELAACAAERLEQLRRNLLIATFDASRN